MPTKATTPPANNRHVLFSSKGGCAPKTPPEEPHTTRTHPCILPYQAPPPKKKRAVDEQNNATVKFFIAFEGGLMWDRSLMKYLIPAKSRRMPRAGV